MRDVNPANSIPRGWALATIDELIGSGGLFCDGNWVESKDQDPKGKIRLIQLADIGDGTFKDKSSRFLTKQRALELNCTFLNQNDILVARMPEPLGRACIFPLEGEGKYVTAVDVCIIRLGKTSVSEKYFSFLINSPVSRNTIEGYKTGSTRKRISRNNLAKIKFPVSPLPEQQRIVTKIEELLSELDKGVENLKAAREQLKVYRQSVLKYAFEGKLTEKWRKEHASELEPAEVLLKKIKAEREQRYQQQLNEWQQAAKTGKRISKPAKPKELPPLTEGELAKLPKLPDGWGWNMLASLADVTGGITKNAERNRFPIKVPFLRVANVYANRLDLVEIHLIGVNEQELRRVLLERGDLLVVEGNGSVEQIGRAAIWRGEIEGCAHQNHLIKVRATRYVYPEYCLHFLLSTQGRNMIMKEASSTSGLYTLSTSKVANLKVPLCSPREQVEVTQEIESRLSVVEQLESTIAESLQKAEALRQSILKKVFEGKLVPQDPSDEPASVLLERIKAEKAKHSKNVVRKKNTGK